MLLEVTAHESWKISEKYGYKKPLVSTRHMWTYGHVVLWHVFRHLDNFTTHVSISVRFDVNKNWERPGVHSRKERKVKYRQGEKREHDCCFQYTVTSTFSHDRLTDKIFPSARENWLPLYSSLWISNSGPAFLSWCVLAHERSMKVIQMRPS